MIYKEMYYHLFNVITDVIQDLENRDYGHAVAILKKAQAGAEELYMENGSAEDEQGARAQG